jgi:lipoprotein-anchoring transpeptidase ErfK/SrfK
MRIEMRKRLIVVAGVAAAFLAGAVASDAASQSYWDQATQKWVKYDGSSKSGKSRTYRRIEKQVVAYNGPYSAPTIVVNTAERRLYYVFEPGKALKYGIGVGREGFQWSGTDRISRKAEWPGWTPPPEMIAREKKKGRILPAHMKGGLNNPLGARALYVGDTIYRIHGSNEPWTIGYAVSSGCIRLTNEDVVDLYDRAPVGTRVVVLSGKEPAAKELVAAKPAPRGFFSLLNAKEPAVAKTPPKGVGSAKKKKGAPLDGTTATAKAIPAASAAPVDARVKDDAVTPVKSATANVTATETVASVAPVTPPLAEASPAAAGPAGIDQTEVR